MRQLDKTATREEDVHSRFGCMLRWEAGVGDNRGNSAVDEKRRVEEWMQQVEASLCNADLFKRTPPVSKAVPESVRVTGIHSGNKISDQSSTMLKAVVIQ